MIWNPDHPIHQKEVEDLKTRAPALGIELTFLGVRSAEQLEPALLQYRRREGSGSICHRGRTVFRAASNAPRAHSGGLIADDARPQTVSPKKAR